MWRVGLCLYCIASGMDDWVVEKPKALEAVEQARLEIRNAELTWSQTNFFDRFAPGARKHKRAIISGRQIALFREGPTTA